MAIARSVFRRWRPVSPTSRPPLPNHAVRPVGAEVDESRGESPTHAAESRPSRKLSIGGANVCTAIAASSPTPEVGEEPLVLEEVGLSHFIQPQG